MDNAQANEFEDGLAANDDSKAKPALAKRKWFGHASLATRIALINILGLIILSAGILYFNQFRQSLINSRVESLLVQGQIIAAAIAGSATADTSSIVIDPGKLGDATGTEGNTDFSQTDYDQAAFAVSCGAVQAPEDWDGLPSKLGEDWVCFDHSTINQCPDEYVTVAQPGEES